MITKDSQKQWNPRITDYLQRKRDKGDRPEASLDELEFLPGYDKDLKKNKSRANFTLRRFLTTQARTGLFELMKEPHEWKGTNVHRIVGVRLPPNADEKERARLAQEQVELRSEIQKKHAELKTWQKPFLSGTDDQIFCAVCNKKFSKNSFEQHLPCPVDKQWDGQN